MNWDLITIALVENKKMSQKDVNLCVAAHSAILTYEKYAPVCLIISALTLAPF